MPRPAGFPPVRAGERAVQTPGLEDGPFLGGGSRAGRPVTMAPNPH